MSPKPSSLSRRRFLQRTAVAGLSLTSVARAGVASPAECPIVDTHEHLWDLSKLRPPWLKPDHPLNRSYLPADYQQAIEGLPVVQSVYMEVDLSPADHEAEAQYVIDLCKGRATPMRAAVIGGRPAGAEFRRYIEGFKGSPYVKGVRHILRGPDELRLLDKPDSLVPGLRLLGKLGMCFDLCVPARCLDAGARLVALCPDTRFVLDHCGNADPKAFGKEAAAASHDAAQWRRDIDAISRRANVVCKISGIVSQVTPGRWSPDDLAPIVNHCLDAFGPDRVMFAGDWPVCTRGAALRQWVEALRQIVAVRSAADQRKLFAENAIKFYGL